MLPDEDDDYEDGEDEDYETEEDYEDENEDGEYPLLTLVLFKSKGGGELPIYDIE